MLLCNHQVRKWIAGYVGEIAKTKEPRVIADSGLKIKDGGFLLSRIALQYHRRRRA